MCHWNETCERGNRWPISGTSDVVIEAFEFVLDPIGRLLADVLGTILVHTAQQHRHVSARVCEDELNGFEFRKRARKKQVGHRPGSILWNLNKHGGDISHQCSTP